jgi:purine-binding chemotaxis protein CheW
MSIAEILDVRQYLTFKLSEEIFAVDVVQVREILDYVKVTKIPQTPDYMCGVINLRGSVVPVIDMGLKFSMTKTEETVNTCIIVVEVKSDEDTLILGALVDSVQEVFELDPKDIEPAPKIGASFKAEFIKGMGKREDQFLIILDIDKVFTSQDMLMVQKNSLHPEEEVILNEQK